MTPSVSRLAVAGPLDRMDRSLVAAPRCAGFKWAAGRLRGAWGSTAALGHAMACRCSCKAGVASARTAMCAMGLLAARCSAPSNTQTKSASAAGSWVCGIAAHGVIRHPAAASAAMAGRLVVMRSCRRLVPACIAVPWIWQDLCLRRSWAAGLTMPLADQTTPSARL